MNFNIYLEDELGKQLDRIAQSTGKSRNALIRDALKKLVVQHQQSAWSESILTFQGIKEAISFESYRAELIPPSESEIFS